MAKWHSQTLPFKESLKKHQPSTFLSYDNWQNIDSNCHTTSSSATADGPRDALCQSKSWQLLHNCRKKCTANPQQIKAMELDGYSWLMCSKQPRLVDCRIGVVNKLDRRRVLLTMRDLPWQNFLCSKFAAKFQREYPYFQRYLNFLITQCKRGRKNQLDSSSRIDTILACNGQTDGKRHEDSVVW